MSIYITIIPIISYGVVKFKYKIINKLYYKKNRGLVTPLDL